MSELILRELRLRPYQVAREDAQPMCRSLVPAGADTPHARTQAAPAMASARTSPRVPRGRDDAMRDLGL